MDLDLGKTLSGIFLTMVGFVFWFFKKTDAKAAKANEVASEAKQKVVSMTGKISRAEARLDKLSEMEIKVAEVNTDVKHMNKTLERLEKHLIHKD